MDKALITGADGFIGRHLTDSLLRSGTEIYAVVYPGYNVFENVVTDKLHVILYDLENGLALLKEMLPPDIDVMYHL